MHLGFHTCNHLSIDYEHFFKMYLHLTTCNWYTKVAKVGIEKLIYVFKTDFGLSMRVKQLHVFLLLVISD